MKLSVRWRLALWNAFSFGVLLVVFAAIVYFLAEQAALATIDRKLTNCLDQFAKDERNVRDVARLRHWIGEFWEHEQVACAVFDQEGRRVERTEELTPDSLPEQASANDKGSVFATTSLPVLQRQRSLSAPLPHDRQGRTVLLLASTAEADRSLAQLQVALLSAVPAVLIAATAVSYLLAGRALAPVTKLTDATRRITAERLADRLPVVNPHDELGRLATTVNDLLARLETAFAEQRRFAADASHELRTPLAVLRAEIEVAQRNLPPATEFPGLLTSLVEECDRLGNLTDQLLTLARQDAEKNPPGWEPFDLATLVRDVANDLRPLADTKGVKLHIEAASVQLLVAGDPDRLRRAFVNLIENAVKYTPSSGEVVVKFASEGGIAQVKVTDTGEGIPADHLPRVFDRFYRVDKARSREQGGTGLGLSIARGIIDSHGGRVELTSEAGRGTTATVMLPLAEPSQREVST